MKPAMKKYVQLSKHKDKHSYFAHDTKTTELELFHFFITFASPKTLLYSISKPNYIGHESEPIDYDIEGENIIIKKLEEYFEDDEDRFIMKFEDFKKMVLQWKELYDKKAPEIYFILENDGSVTVQDFLKDHGTNP